MVDLPEETSNQLFEVLEDWEATIQAFDAGQDKPEEPAP